MIEYIDNLCNLTLHKNIKWETIDKLIVDGEPYLHFQHILPSKSFFTTIENTTVVVLYGEMRNWVDNSIIKDYFLQNIEENTIRNLEVPKQDIVKLHTIISLL